MLRAGIYSGEYYEAVHQDEGMVGFLMVMPPGKDLFSTEEQRALGLTEFMDSLSAEGKEYYKTTASAKPDVVALSTTTDLNAEIYQKVGFAVRGKKEMPSPWGNYPLYIFSLRD
ncbi:hypothetical protein EIP86_004049 [Pleurotus ostreatoroseus]|nr:hypothetical protein EIP86_004049 [Pleurotus ostreatoroseus]